MEVSYTVLNGGIFLQVYIVSNFTIKKDRIWVYFACLNSRVLIGFQRRRVQFERVITFTAASRMNCFALSSQIAGTVKT